MVTCESSLPVAAAHWCPLIALILNPGAPFSSYHGLLLGPPDFMASWVHEFLRAAETKYHRWLKPQKLFFSYFWRLGV